MVDWSAPDTEWLDDCRGEAAMMMMVVVVEECV